MQSFREYLIETSDAWAVAAKKHGAVSTKDFPYPTHGLGTGAHGWLDKSGTFWKLPNKMEHEDHAANVSKSLGTYKGGSQVRQAMQNHHLVRVAGFGSAINIQSHHALTPQQHSVLRDAVHNNGFNEVHHESGDDYFATTSQRPMFKREVEKVLRKEN